MPATGHTQRSRSYDDASKFHIIGPTRSHVHGQAPWQGSGLQPALKFDDDDDTPGGRRGVETTVEQALMRGLVTA